MSRRPRSDRSARRVKPRPNRKRRNLVPLIFWALCLGLVAQGVYAGLTSPRFAIRSVEVEGNRKVPARQILQAAGIPRGTNIFLERSHKKAVKVARIPRVQSVEIHRRFPNRMVIRVEERRPALLLAAGSNYYLVDETGVPYAKLDEVGHKLPVLRLQPAPVFTLGQPLKTPAFVAGVKALPAMKGLIAGGGALWVDSHLNLCLNRGDFSARLGQPEGLNRKIQLLKSLLDTHPRLLEKAEYVDLSAPEAPALMPKNASESSASGTI
ncbi:MAG: FtsQ-type POTRA domain-containing protein [Armatimonadetes bacterium]|nr:FtsQ-type POTRA domain-containing protein [Armatimonadota bacterium]